MHFLRHLSWISALFEPSDQGGARAPRDFARFDLGVCPGCRGLRSVGSPQCAACDSTAPVAADA